MIKYNSALCPFLNLPDSLKQTYEGVTTQVYPLRAETKRVGKFLDNYINKCPLIRFEPVAPFIVMQVCNYPSVSTDSNQQGVPHRWFAQHEVAFGIPVACYEPADKGRFKELAMVYPFIFVDNPLSMAGGRQVYGWSKAGIEFEPLRPEFRPNEPRRLLAVRINPFSRLPTRKDTNLLPASVAGRGNTDDSDSGDCTFLRVFQTRPFLSGRGGIAEAIAAVPRALGGFFAASAGLLETMGSLLGYVPPRTGSLGRDLIQLAIDLQSVGQVVGQFYGYMNVLIPIFATMALGRPDSAPGTGGPEPVIYTLKQVSDVLEDEAHYPMRAGSSAEAGGYTVSGVSGSPQDHACYQAIVRSQMKVENAKDGGLLFDPLSGDPTGGIEIRLERDSANEELNTLIEMLSATPSEQGSRQVFSLRPLMPFWANLDLSYGLADRQWWRTKYTGWQAQPGDNSMAEPPDIALDYIKGDSGAKLQIKGKRVAKNAVMHIFPLKAEEPALKTLLDRYLNEPVDQEEHPFKFVIRSPFVYITLLSYDNMQVDEKSYGNDRVLTFSVLADYCDSGNGKPRQAFIPLYHFVNTDWNFITEYEVYGRLAFRSELASPEDTWIKDSAPGETAHEVLSIRTTLFPEPEGKAADLRLIRIVSEPWGKSRQVNDIQAWLAEQTQDHLLNYLTLDRAERPSLSVALKQVRNAIRPQEADYQSMVGIEREFKVHPPLSTQSARIEIFNYETFPLVKEMGLLGPRETDIESRVAFDCIAFSIRGDLSEDAGTELWRRVAPGNTWRKVLTGARDGQRSWRGEGTEH